jgi:hypothetical protein
MKTCFVIIFFIASCGNNENGESNKDYRNLDKQDTVYKNLKSERPKSGEVKFKN